MPAETFELPNGLIMLIISGKLTYDELVATQAETQRIIKQHGKVRILCLAEDFQGWEKTEKWGDLAFQEENDARIEKMAIVGDPKWKDLALAFVAAGLREFPIEYFSHGEVAKARAWLRD